MGLFSANEAAPVGCPWEGLGSAERQYEDTEVRRKPEAAFVTGGQPWIHTYSSVLPRFLQSVQAASLAQSLLEGQFLHPADGGSYGLFHRRSSILLPFHRLSGSPERNRMGLSPAAVNNSCQPAVSQS